MNAVVSRATSLFEGTAFSVSFPAGVDRGPCDEAWFSDRLAWLLDRRGDHGFGARFADEFLKVLARVRTQNFQDEDDRHGQREQHLRPRSCSDRGASSTGFDLRKASVFREFHIARDACSRRRDKAVFCDLAFLDLDPTGGIFVAIENKLFTTDHDDQLARYHAVIETRFSWVKMREYAYLTLFGDAPVFEKDAGSACRRAWLRISWVEDILPIIENLSAEGQASDGVHELADLLRWFRHVRSCRAEVDAITNQLLSAFIATAGEILVEELRRLNAGMKGEWRVERRSHTRMRIVHSSKPKASLTIGLLANLSIFLFSRKKSSKKHERRLIPLGSNGDQFCNLMDMVARDVYPLHFGASCRLYLGDANRLRREQSGLRRRSMPLIQLVHARQREIRLLMGMSRLPVGDGPEGRQLVAVADPESCPA